MIYPTLYKLDSVGRLRTWAMELAGSTYRTLAGLADGKQAISGWTQAVAASQDTDEQQAVFEVNAKYAHQLAREYHDNPTTVSQPKMIEPMLAKVYTTWPGPGFAQPKLDGIRCIMNNDGCGMWTRQGQPIIAVPHLRAAAQPLFDKYPDLILDGELYNHELRDDFGAISSIVRKKNPTAEQPELAERVMQYHVYDTVDTDSSFEERAVFLNEAIVNLDCPWLVLVPTERCHTAEQADTSYAEAIGAGYEGGMYRLDTPYEIGRRSKNLLKRKEFMTDEFPVEDILEGNGNWAGAAKTFVLRNRQRFAEVENASFGKGRFGAGVRGSYAKLKALLADGKPGPNATATLRYFQLSPDGVPRFPVVIDYHPEGRTD